MALFPSLLGKAPERCLLWLLLYGGWKRKIIISTKKTMDPKALFYRQKHQKATGYIFPLVGVLTFRQDLWIIKAFSMYSHNNLKTPFC